MGYEMIFVELLFQYLKNLKCVGRKVRRLESSNLISLRNILVYYRVPLARTPCIYKILIDYEANGIKFYSKSIRKS